MPKTTVKNILVALTDDKINIDLCAKYIKEIEEIVSDTSCSDYLGQLVNYYITGQVFLLNPSPQILLYKKLVRWSVSQQVFLNLIFSIKSS